MNTTMKARKLYKQYVEHLRKAAELHADGATAAALVFVLRGINSLDACIRIVAMRDKTGAASAELVNERKRVWAYHDAIRKQHAEHYEREHATADDVRGEGSTDERGETEGTPAPQRYDQDS